MPNSDTVKGRYSSYTLLNDVGHGGSARVFRAQDVATKKIVAVKQLFGNRPQDREDWLREVDALNTLNNHHCPHVVQYLDHMQQHDKLFLVEEFAEQGSLLRQLRSDGPLAEGVVCNIVFQVLTALHRMAQWGIVHGDLKASNLLLFDEDVVKLTDFALRSRGSGGDEEASELRATGVADRQTTWATSSTTPGPPSSFGEASSESRLTGSPSLRTRAGTSATWTTNTTATFGATKASGEGDEDHADAAAIAAAAAAASSSSSPLIEFRGSVYWAAPEVLAGESRMTAASDVWAVACTAIELLSGAPPYFDRTLPNATHYVLKHYYAMMEADDTTSANTAKQRGEGKGADSAKINTAANVNKEPVEAREQRIGDAGMDVKGSRSSGDGGSQPKKHHRHHSGSEKKDGGDDNDECADRSGSDDDAPVEASHDPHVLLPSLPDSLHLSDECVSFLRLCLHLRPAERPSASELLQHPWFLSVVVPPLLRAAREGRVMNMPGEDDGGAPTATNTNNINSTSNSAIANAGGRFAVIERWVEMNLLSDQAARCAAWLQSDALPLLVPVLTPRIITPTYIGHVMKCFSQFAESSSPLASLFLDRLGATELWSVEELTSACDADHLVTLFKRCCEVQDPNVAVFTPTHPSALRFVLGLEKAKVLECVAVLHQLFVGAPLPPQQQPLNTSATSSSFAGVAAANSEATHTPDDLAASGREKAEENMRQQRQLQQQLQEEEQEQSQRRARACERLLRDGGAAVLCQSVEWQCKAAFVNGTAPTLEWTTVDRLLDILRTIETLPGGKTLLWGLPGEDTAGQLSTTTGSKAAVQGTASAASMMTPRSDTANTNISNNYMNNTASAATLEGASQPPPPPLATQRLTSPVSPTPRSSPSPPSSAAAGAAGHSTTSAAASAALAAVNSVSGGAHIHDSSNNTFGNASAGPGVTDAAWASSLTWLLAVQEAAHHGSDAAVLLLAHYIPLAKESGAEYLEKAGTSLTATLVFFASNDAATTAARCAAVASLPRLQVSSLRAARYLRDPIRCLPLLALTLKRAAAVPPLVTAMMSALQALTTEKQTLVAAAGSLWMWEALISLLQDVVGVQGSTPSSDHRGDAHEAGPRTDAECEKDAALSVSSSVAGDTHARRDDEGQSSSTDVASNAMLADVVSLISQWLADLSPPALLSIASAAAASAAHRETILSSPSLPTSLSPSLPAILQAVREQLTELAHHEVVCKADLLTQVDKALESLSSVDAGAAVPAPK